MSIKNSLGTMREYRGPKRPQRVRHIIAVVDTDVFVTKWWRTAKQYWEYDCTEAFFIVNGVGPEMYELDDKAKTLLEGLG